MIQPDRAFISSWPAELGPCINVYGFFNRKL